MFLVIIVALFVVFLWLFYFFAFFDRKNPKSSAGQSDRREFGSDENARFTRAQALAKLGQPVRVIGKVPDIPKGTLGHVTQIDEIESGQFDLIVEWSVRVGGRIQHDWFSREQFERCLVDEAKWDALQVGP